MTHPWMPMSPCGPSCVRRGATVGVHLATLRLSRAGGVMLLGAGLALVLPVLPTAFRQGLVRAWYRALLRAFGVRLVVHGRADLGAGGLVVSNHVSWLDVIALQTLRPMRLLAKSEVGAWPVVGPLARRAGALFIDRDRLGTLRRAVRAITEALRADALVGAFPEGTTWCGPVSGRYRPAVFQAAVDAGSPVHPVALLYRRADGEPTTVAAFVGEATLIESVLAVARARDLVIDLFLLAALDAREIPDRRELARRAEAATNGALHPRTPALPHPEPVAA